VQNRTCTIDNKEHALAGKKRTFGSANSSAACIEKITIEADMCAYSSKKCL
jgi:hypothetical protein